MKPARVLYLSDHQLAVYQVQDGSLSETASFIHNEEGHAEFEAYLARNPPTQVRLVVDSRQEEFRRDLVPKVSAGDRRAMLRHKARRAFPHTPYTYAWVERNPARPGGAARKEDPVMYAALSNPGLLAPWVLALLKYKVAIRSIASLPLLSQNLLERLSPGPYSLLVSHTGPIGSFSDYGLRQSFFRSRQFAASRLIPLRSLDQGYAEYVAGEIFKTAQYLHGQGLLQEDQPLDIILLEPVAVLQGFQDYLRTAVKPGNFNYRLIDLQRFGQQLGVSHFDPPHFSSLVAYHHLRRGDNHYAQTDQRRYYHHHQARLGLYAAALLLGLGGAGAAGWVFYQGAQAQSRAADLRRDADGLNRAMQELQKQRQGQLAGLSRTEHALHLKNAVDAADHIHRQRRDPHRALSLLGGLLFHFQQLQIKQLDWEVVARDLGEGRPVGGLLRAQPTRSVSLTLLEVLKIGGSIRQTEGDNLITAQNTLTSFARLLEQEANVYSVQIIDSPLKQGGQTRLSGVVGVDRPATEADFTLEVTFRYADQQE